MHPPWITFNFLLLLLATTNAVSKEADQNEAVNGTVSRPQRETHERERRLIPYMTYYVTQSLTGPNVGARQNILIPVTSSREHPFQFSAVPKIRVANIQEDNPQTVEILPKPVLRLTSPAFLTPTIQVDKTKESRTSPQIYRIESGVLRPRIQTQVQPQQIQSETQPHQIVKVNSLPAEQKYNAPQIIKIIPVITKVQLEDRPGKSFSPAQPHYTYQEGKVSTSAHYPSTVNYQNHYKGSLVPLQHENYLQGNKISPGNAQPGLIGPTFRPDTNKYTIARIVLSTTTPSPYGSIKYNAEDGGVSQVEGNAHQVPIVQVSNSNPPRVEYGRSPVVSTERGFLSDNYATATPGQEQISYAGREQSLRPEEVIQSQKTEQIPKLRVPEEEKIRFVASVTPVPVTNDLENPQWRINNAAAAAAAGQGRNLYDNGPQNNIFSLLKETNKLPQNLTPDNIDTGIKTLAYILERLQQQKNLYQAHKAYTSGATTAEPPTATATQSHQNPKKVHSFPEKSGTSTPGRPGVDYPTYSSIPQTSFDCSTQRYKGFFGDPETKCQVWHYCDLNGGQASFLCPNGTIFSQVALTCDWWFNVKCASTSQLYVLNERLYKYILPFSPSFPEDYSGPIVDTYLEAKFKEMEAKTKQKALKSLTNSTTTEKTEMTTETATDASEVSAEGLQEHSGEP